MAGVTTVWAGLSDHERAMADEGIARLEAAIERAIEKGMDPEEAIDRHIDAVVDTWPHAALVMVVRSVELTKERAS